MVRTKKDGTKDKRHKNKGNPHIGNLSKLYSTGPRTIEGKRKSAMNLMKNGRYSKTIMDYRANGCDKCPLGEKEIKMRVGNKTITKIKPALCPYYRKGSMECLLPVEGMVARLKNFETLSDIDTVELQKQMIMESFGNAKQAEIVEMMKDGRAGFYTKEFSEMALKYLTELNKMQSIQKIKTENTNVNVNVDVDYVPMEDIIGEDKE